MLPGVLSREANHLIDILFHVLSYIQIPVQCRQYGQDRISTFLVVISCANLSLSSKVANCIVSVSFSTINILIVYMYMYMCIRDTTDLHVFQLKHLVSYTVDVNVCITEACNNHGMK